MMEEKKGEYKILFVCLGNICRSPSAEAVMKKLVQDAGLDGRIKIDLNPAKRKATPIKNEKRFSEQKRKAMKIIKAILEIVSPLLLH